MPGVCGHPWVEAAPSVIRDRIEFTVSTCGTKGIEVKLTDISGRKIIESRLPVAAGKALLILPGDKMPPGVYFITAKSSTATTTTKVVKR